MCAAHVLITGAAGQIGYILAFRIAGGDLLGNRKVVLHLLEIPQALPRLEGVVMELHDSSFPLLEDIIFTDKPEVAFKDVDYAFLVASVPLKQGQVRADLLKANAPIFKMQGEMLSKYSKPIVKVLVIGNPANTNCLIAMRAAKNLRPENFSCLCRLDHNRCLYQLSKKLEVPTTKIYKIVVWGNHSESQVPDIHYAEYETNNGVTRKVSEVLDVKYLEGEFCEQIAGRAWKVFEKRGLTSAGSAVNASLNQMRDWIFGTKTGDFVSMGIPVPKDSPYGIKSGIVFSFPCKVDKYGKVHVVKDLELNEWTEKKLKITEEDLLGERETAFKDLGFSNE